MKNNKEDIVPLLSSSPSQTKEVPPNIDHIPHVGFLHPTKKLKWVVLFFVCMTIVGSYNAYDSIAVIATELMEELNITQAEYGLLYSVYSVPNMFLPLIGGIILDKFGVRRGIMVYLSLISLGTFFVALAPLTGKSSVYYVMLLGRFLFGLGAESSYVAQETFCFIWFHEKYLAVAMGFISAFGRMAEIFTFNTTAVISHTFGSYHYSLWFTFCVTLVSFTCGAIACYFDRRGEKIMKKEGIRRMKAVEEPEEDGSGDEEENNNYGTLGNQPTKEKASFMTRSKEFIVDFIRELRALPPSYWAMSLVLTSFFSTIFPFISFASDFLQIKYGYDEISAGRMVSLLSLTSMSLSPVLGLLLDLYGKRIWACNIGNLLMIPACLGLGFTDIHPSVFIVTVGAMYALVPAAIWPSAALLVPEASFSTAYGLTTSIANSGLAPTYWLIGRLVDDSHAIKESCLLLAVVSAIGLVFGVVWQILDARAGSPCNNVARKAHHRSDTFDSLLMPKLKDKHDT